MDHLIEQILRETNYLNNPYFVHLNDGSFEKIDFVETQIQFYFAVEFFARPMSALASKIPCPKQRIGILRNVWEEHGEGDTEKFHKYTFLSFLKSLDNCNYLSFLKRLDNCNYEKVNSRVLWPELRIFNTVLDGVCNSDNYLIGVGALGMIERMFSDISFCIGQNVIKRGWFTPSQLIHYELHETLDIKHAEDFFTILRSSWNAEPESRSTIEQGLRLGSTLFNGLYEGLFRARARRWIKKESPVAEDNKAAHQLLASIL